MKFDNIIRFFKRLYAFVPTRLPQGLTEFNTWSDDILDIYGIPNNDSTKFTLAVMVLHLPPQQAYKAKEYFGRSLWKAAAAEVVANVIQTLKQKQQEQIAAENAKRAEEAKQSEATTALKVVSNDIQN